MRFWSSRSSRGTRVIVLTAIFVVHGNPRDARAVDFLTLQPVDDGDAFTDFLGRANTTINTVPFKCNALQTVGNQQFISYYHHDGKLVVGRRYLGVSQWDLFKTEFTSFNINDAHNTSSIAIDGNGLLHMSWGMHNNSLLYTKSTGSVLGNAPIELIGAAVGNSAAPNTMTGLYNSGVTYPEFYNLPGGDLLFTYRNGGSGNGDYRLRHYDAAAEAWSDLGPADFNHIWLGRQDPAGTLTTVNAYPNGLAFDSQGNIHATWTWRTGSSSTTGQSGFQTNHHLQYARSADGGATWTAMDGTPYTLPIYETNAEIAVFLPEGSSIINTTGMAIDRLDQPVVASWWAPEAPQGNHDRQYMLAWYDNSLAEWRTSQISNRTVDGMPSSPLPESRVRDVGRPIVVVDDDNRVIVVYRDNEGTRGLTAAFSESTERNDWQFLDLTSDNLGNFEPTYDALRWERDRVLSILYQPVGLGSVAAPVSVLEWDVRSYFADLGQPKLTLLVDRGSGHVEITNASGASVEIDGYSIRSPSGALDPGSWHSLQSQMIGDWVESNVSATQFNELNPTGSLTLADGASVLLGAPFAPPYTHFGQPAPQDLVFEFHRAAGSVGAGLIQYTGVSLNNLVLVIDPTSGAAELHNTSAFDVSIDAYTIVSPSESLSTDRWNSLQEQGLSGGTWVESNVSPSRLSELNPLADLLLVAGGSLSLGYLYDPAGEADLELAFALVGEPTAMTGAVLYTPLSLAGDFNNDGLVNAADYVLWRKTGASQEQYDEWRANFGAVAGGGAVLGSSSSTAVPEPSALVVLLTGMLAMFIRRWRLGALTA